MREVSCNLDQTFKITTQFILISNRIKDTDLNFGRWSIRDVHDPKFNEEKLAIQFRCGRLGYFGLAINWYCNLPYQTWELKPDTKE